jgi:hypothetical protein
MSIRLGDKARDTITGFEGIAVAKTNWLYGCTRCTLQPTHLDKDGKMIGSETFDEPQLELVEAAQQELVAVNTGGPRPEPIRNKDPR